MQISSIKVPLKKVLLKCLKRHLVADYGICPVKPPAILDYDSLAVKLLKCVFSYNQ